MLTVGIACSLNLMVASDKTAKFVQSGGAEVLATPILINLVERCAWQGVLPYMSQNTDTVGTYIEVKHLSPTPVGMTVRCFCELVAINDRELVFNFEVFDDAEQIAQGNHKRFIIQCDKFQNKADSKLK